MTTDKTIKSKYQPKQTNVAWIDLSGEKPVEKHFVNGRWQVISGGGSGAGSSNPTEADATKVWQVTPVQKGTKTEETVIVPEQTLVDKQELEYNDKFVPGAQCVAVVNGVEYRGEVVVDEDVYAFYTEFGSFGYLYKLEKFVFMNKTESPEVTAKLSVIEETPIYDYNWAPGVKIPIPTAEDEDKILVVTKVEGDNTSTIVPEQEVPEDYHTPLTDVDLKYFVPGNTVTATVIIQQGSDEEEKKGGDVLLKVSESSNSNTLVVSGTIEQKGLQLGVPFNEGQEDEFYIVKIPIQDSDEQTDYVLVTNLGSVISSSSEPGRGNTLPYATIKLEYSEPNYEYQLQENSGGGSSNILYCEGSNDGHGLITAYIDSSELDNPQITTIVVDTGDGKSYFYRMEGESWLVSGFASFADSNEWIKEWNTEGQYPTIYAYFFQK